MTLRLVSFEVGRITYDRHLGRFRGTVQTKICREEISDEDYVHHLNNLECFVALPTDTSFELIERALLSEAKTQLSFLATALSASASELREIARTNSAS
jgi:hypothetical protein